MKRAIAAIDPSLTSSGVCYGTDGDDYTVTCCQSKPRGKTVLDRVKRYEGLVGDIVRIISVVKPAMIFIEEYAYSKNMGGQMYLGEFGGILRWNLVDYTPHVYEVTASALKKFATGKGNSPKDVVMAHLAKRYGRLFQNNDEADSFALYQMALVASGRIEADNQGQRDSVSKVLSGHALTSDQVRTMCSADPDDKPF